MSTFKFPLRLLSEAIVFYTFIGNLCFTLLGTTVSRLLFSLVHFQLNSTTTRKLSVLS